MKSKEQKLPRKSNESKEKLIDIVANQSNMKNSALLKISSLESNMKKSPILDTYIQYSPFSD